MNNITLGFYLGSLFMIILYNLQWYVTNKRIAYLYYSILQFCMILLVIQENKIINLKIEYFIITAITAIIFTLLFSKEFLELKKYYEKINTLVNIIIAVIILITIFVLINKNYMILDQPYSLLFFPFIPIGYLVYKKGFKPAIFYTFAWGISISFMLLNDLEKVFEFADFREFPFIALGNFFEALILSYALSYKTKLLVQEKKKQEQLLIHQNRLASMGEMLNNISHQWRQPLNRIASFIMNMQMHILDTYKKEEFLLKKLDESQNQLEYMSQTIDDFSNFFKKDKKKDLFFISEVINNSKNIIQSSLDASKIGLEIKIIKDYKLNSYSKELAQVILNILQNSKDALLANNIEDALIKIQLNENILSLEDNAGGIALNIINNIYDPYFSTKDKSTSTGIGLYMSKTILNNNLNAKIKAENINKGVRFIISFEKSNN